MEKNINLLIFGIVGGSGAGKTELAKLLLKHYFDILTFSVSGTTRPAGANERHGIDYHFYSHERFAQLEQEKHFLETNSLATGNRYGTPLSELQRAQNLQKILLVDLEINGAKQIYDQYPDNSKFVFLDVDDSEAERRLKNAGTRKREKIPERILNLQQQRLLVHQYDWMTTIIDTTNFEVTKIYDCVVNTLLNEISFRKSYFVSS